MLLCLAHLGQDRAEASSVPHSTTQGKHSHQGCTTGPELKPQGLLQGKTLAKHSDPGSPAAEGQRLHQGLQQSPPLASSRSSLEEHAWQAQADLHAAITPAVERMLQVAPHSQLTGPLLLACCYVQ